MVTKLLLRVVVITIDRRLFKRAVHALHLSVRPGMIGLGQPMLNLMFGTDAVKQQRKGITVRLSVGELDAVVGQNSVDLVGHSGDEMTKEFGSHQAVLALV